MKKWLLGMLFLSIFLTRGAFASDLVWWWQKIGSYENTLEKQINKCKLDGGEIEVNFRIVNWKTINVYFCKFNENNICDLESYYLWHCLLDLNKPEPEKKEEDLWKYKALILEYRDVLYKTSDFKFTTILNWWLGLYAEKNLAKWLSLLDFLDSNITKIIHKKPKFKEPLLSLIKENARIRDKLFKQYITDDIVDLSPIKPIMWWKLTTTEVKKLDTWYYKVTVSDWHIESEFEIKISIDKTEKSSLKLNIEIVSEREI